MTVAPDIEGIERRANEAEQWSASDLYEDTCAQCKRDGEKEFGLVNLSGGYHAQFGHAGSAQFIAHAPADIRALLAEVKRLRAREEELSKLGKEFFDWVTARLWKVTYEFEELEKPLPEIEAWRELAEAKFNGTFAAWEQDFTTALSPEPQP